MSGCQWSDNGLTNVQSISNGPTVTPISAANKHKTHKLSWPAKFVAVFGLEIVLVVVGQDCWPLVTVDETTLSLFTGFSSTFSAHCIRWPLWRQPRVEKVAGTPTFNSYNFVCFALLMIFSSAKADFGLRCFDYLINTVFWRLQSSNQKKPFKINSLNFYYPFQKLYFSVYLWKFFTIFVHIFTYLSLILFHFKGLYFNILPFLLFQTLSTHLFIGLENYVFHNPLLWYQFPGKYLSLTT